MSILKILSRFNRKFYQVGYLIDSEMSWKRDLIERVYGGRSPGCSQYTYSLQPKDKLIWRCAPNGQFSIRSAYYMDKEAQATHGGENSQPHSRSPIWKLIWNLPISNAVKMFLW
jgi:hypothetical protein